MNFLQLIKHSWKVTWCSWQLWALSLLMLLTFLPALLIGSSFGTLTSALTLPLPPEFSGLTQPLRQLPGWAWALIVMASLGVMVVSTAASCALQAAAMREASACADSRPLGMRGSLRLGRERLFNILKLSVLYGVLIALLALIPPAVLLLVPDESFVRQVSSSMFSSLAPINSVLGIVLLLLLITLALEEVRAEDAPRRTWQVFRKGWKEFFLVVGITLGTGVVQIGLLVPPLVALGVALARGDGWIWAAVCGGLFIPLAFVIWLSTGVFTLVLYTLVYRAAAGQAPPAEPAPQAAASLPETG
jgi:hypothetical protein